MGEQKRKKASFTYKFKKSKREVTTVLVVFILGVALYYQFMDRLGTSPLTHVDPRRTKGSSEAPLQILEFIDLPCRECKRGNDILRGYFEEFPEGLSLSVKYFPLGQLNSTGSAIHAQCAARQNKFWPFYEELISRQDEWRSLLNVEVIFNIIAKDVGLDVAALAQCVKDPEIKTLVLREQLLGESWGVQITPTYFINDEMMVGVEALESALKGFFDEETDVYMFN